jgi:pimeloyl-ACP methyl ester carboxylesterase
MLQRHYFKRVDGVRLHWAEVGDDSRDNPPLVLLHGLNDCYRTWKHQACRLARDRRVIMLDLPGHGLSERPDATYELEWYAQIVGQWFANADLEVADVVGHSFGGGVAQMLLLGRPGRIRRLVLVSSGGLGREVALALRLAAFTQLVERLGQPFMKPVTLIALRAQNIGLSKKEASRLATINSQRGSARAFARTVRDVIDWQGQRRTLFHRVHELPELPAIAVFWGDRDPIIPVSHARDLSRSVEGIRLVEFKGSGHSPHRQAPDAFEEALRDFLDARLVPSARLRAAPAGARSTEERATA